MEAGFEQYADGDLLAVIGAALDALCDDRLRLPSDRERLDLALASLRLNARLQAWQSRLLAGIETDEVAWREHRTSTTTWLAEAGNLTPREARRLVRAGQELERFDVVRDAASSGTVLPAQAEAITSVLRELPDDFPTVTVSEAQELMVGFAATHNSAELRRLTSHLLDVLSPDTADAVEEKRLERQQRRAQSRRFLDFHGDGDGSVLIRGSLPIAQAEPFITIIDAYADAEKRALDVLDPHSEHITPAMRRADALTAMTHRHTQESLAPNHGGDRPRIVVTLSYDKLLRQCTDHGLGAHLTRTGHPLPAGVARQLLCDADLVPIVLGGQSEILDVGRTRRLVTPAIRAALEQRDQGCAFPGCDKPPQACHAHHIRPWWNGGDTALTNLVLVCAHHHGIIEPSHDPAADRWQVQLRPNGQPEVLPPTRVDPRHRPRRHARYLTPMRN